MRTTTPDAGIHQRRGIRRMSAIAPAVPTPASTAPIAAERATSQPQPGHDRVTRPDVDRPRAHDARRSGARRRARSDRDARADGPGAQDRAADGPPQAAGDRPAPRDEEDEAARLDRERGAVQRQLRPAEVRRPLELRRG